MTLYLRPDADSLDGAWTNDGGNNTNLYASLNETSASDAEYIQSPADPAAEVCRIALSNPAGSVAEPFTVSYRFNNLGGATLTVRLLQGTTEIAAWEETASGWTTSNRTLTGPQFAAITDFTNLFVELSASGGVPADPTLPLDLDFTAMAGTLNSKVTFTRSSAATYVNSSGVLTSAGSDAPRFDHSPVTLAPRGLLLEDQRVNLCLNSQNIWTVGGWTIFSAESPDSAIAPDGLMTGDRVTGQYQSPAIAVSTGTVHTTSIYAKAGTASWVWLSPYDAGNWRCWFNLATGTIGTVTAGTTARIADAGNGWWRLEVTHTQANTPLHLMASSVDADGSGTSTGTAYWWGAQVEAGSFASSYIPTTSLAVTRAVDNARMIGSNFSSWYNATEGTFAIDAAVVSPNHYFNANQTADPTNNRIAIYANDPVTPVMYVQNGGAAQVNTIMGTSAGGGLAVNKMAFAFKANDFGGCTDGRGVITDTAGTIPTVDRLQIGASEIVSPSPLIWVRRLRFYNVRKTNAELRGVTGAPPMFPNLHGWYDVADVSSVTGAGLPAVDQWSDQLGVNNLTIGGEQRPSLEAFGLNGLRAIYFQTDFSHGLSKPGIVKAGTNLITIFGVMTCTANNKRPFAIEDSDDGSDFGANSVLIYTESTTSLAIYHNGALRAQAPYAVNVPFRFCAVLDGANATLYTNNIAGTSGAVTNTIGASGTHKLRIGNDGRFSELGVYWGTALDATQRAALDADLARRWAF